jgi:soluble lytic murein transglycosylase-like protein
MILRFIGMMCVALLAAAFLAIPAEAKCTNFQKQYNGCVSSTKKKVVNTKKKSAKYAQAATKKKYAKVKTAKKYAKAKTAKRVYAGKTAKNKVYASKRKRGNQQVARRGGPERNGAVVAMIKRMAPSYGVPTWFALRIAKIESGFRPSARGAAGEYGVYQLKCATARGIGFRGNCSALLNAHTNVQYGLKHLSLAVRASRGNLKLAASKHNGGLGRKRLVHKYVAAVF